MELNVRGEVRILTAVPHGDFEMNKQGRLAIFSEIWHFMKVRKKWWLGPMIVMLVVVAALLVFVEVVGVHAPFIYALF